MDSGDSGEVRISTGTDKYYAAPHDDRLDKSQSNLPTGVREGVEEGSRLRFRIDDKLIDPSIPKEPVKPKSNDITEVQPKEIVVPKQKDAIETKQKDSSEAKNKDSKQSNPQESVETKPKESTEVKPKETKPKDSTEVKPKEEPKETKPKDSTEVKPDELKKSGNTGNIEQKPATKETDKVTAKESNSILLLRKE